MDIVYVSDTNTMGKTKFKWMKWLFSKLDPTITLRQCFTPSEVFYVEDEEYVVTFEKGKPFGRSNGKSNDKFTEKMIMPDAVIIDDIQRSNPGCSEKIYNRSRILYECLLHGVQTHILAPDISMAYCASTLELAKGVSLPNELIKNYSDVHVWYGVNDLKDLDKVSIWKGMSNKLPGHRKHCNFLTGVCYSYMSYHGDELKESCKYPEKDKYGYYGYWRSGVLLDEILDAKLDTVIGSFKWRTPCEIRGIEWINGNKSLEQIFSTITKSFIPYEPIKCEIQHTFRQFEGLAYARNGVEYSGKYPENMKVYDLKDPKLRMLYGTIIKEFLDTLQK